MEKRKLRQRIAALGAAVLCMGALGACTIGESAENPATKGHAALQAAPLAPALSVENGETGVNPTTPVLVKSLGEGLAEVTMTNEDGYQVKSQLSPDGKSWTTDEVLGYGRTYTLRAEDRNGAKVTASFTTVAPQGTLSVALSPLADSTVGVAQTIGFRFSQAVPDKAAAQKALHVSTEPPVEGAFYWLNAQEVRWRPAEFWQPGTTVTVKADIYGANLGGGFYGARDNATNFTIGDDVRTVVDDASKSMTVYRNGAALRTIPVSLGRDTQRWATPNGTYIVGDRYDSIVMDSSTFGLAVDDGGYKTDVKWATQLSYSGIFVHAAPWSVGQQGYSNTSHGCVNVSNEAAQWFFNTVKRGDPVEVRGTVGSTLSGVDGLGDWNIPWEQWKAGNAN